MNRGAIALAVAALVLGLAVGTGLGRPAPVPGEAGPDTQGTASDPAAPSATTIGVPAAVQSAATDAGPASGPNVASARFDAPLPPEDTPLAGALPALQAAAEAGSIEAIRRLFAHTRRCHLHAQARFSLDMALGFQEDIKNMAEGIGPKAVVAVTGPEGPGAHFNRMAEGAAGKMSEDEVLCAGYDDPDDALRFEAQWRAALAGELEGLIRFVLEPAIDTGRAWQQLGRIERYGDRAPAFLQQALAAGSAQAAAHLMDAHDPGWKRSEAEQRPAGQARVLNRVLVDAMPPPPVRQVMKQDAALAWRYATLCERVCPDHAQERAQRVLERLRPELDAETRARAEAEAARLREAHFGSVREVPWFPDLNDQPASREPPKGP